MTKEDGVVGHLSTPTKESVKAQIDEYRKKALPGDGATFDTERLSFHIHGKHATLIGVEAVVTVTLHDLIGMLTPVLGPVVVPILGAAYAQTVKMPPKGKQS